MYGELRDFPLWDLLPTLTRRTGALDLAGLPTGSCRLFLAAGAVTHFQAAALPGAEAEQLRYLLALIPQELPGSFRFTTLPDAQIPHTITWPLDWLLQTALTTHPAAALPPALLADLDAVYAPTARVASNLHTLPVALCQDLLMLEAVLNGRRPVREVAAVLGLAPAMVLASLARLRALGFVAPVRQFNVSVPIRAAAGPRAPAPPALPGLLRRMAALLHRRLA